MPQYIKDPDGTVHSFDDGATPDQINAQMQSFWQKKQATPQSNPVIPGSTPGGMQPMEGAPDLRMVPLSDEAERYKRLALMGGMMGNRALQTAGTNLYEHDNTFVARNEAAKGAGQQAQKLAAMGAAGKRILPGIDALRHMIDTADDETWGDAAGPKNAQVMNPAVEFPLHPTAYIAPPMTPTQARTMWYGFDLNNPNSTRNTKAWDLQNSMQHLVGALTDQYIASIPGGAAAVNSDAKMKVFKDMMEKAIFASSRAKAHEILNTADDAARNVFSLEARPGGPANPIPVQTPEEAKKKYRGGTYVRTPDGRTLVTP